MKEEILKYYYGYDYLKKEQSQIIDSVLAGFDTIGILPTGFGKTICFVIPALILDGITIVVCPLISLMVDQVKNLKEKGISAEFLNSNLDDYQKEKVLYKIKKGDVKIIYVAAERLLNKAFLASIDKLKIDLIVVDEAHTLLWSEDFRFGMIQIKDFILRQKIRPKMLALTATSTSSTTEKITDILCLKNPKVIRFECDRKNIFYRIIKTKNKDLDLINYLKNKEGKIIIYALTIKNVIHIKNILDKYNFKYGIYHSKLDRCEKVQAYLDFNNEKFQIMVATNAFGMGIDIPDIRYVIEYDLHLSIEDFSQQTGRASRDGAYAEGVLLFNLNDIKTIDYFISNIDNKNVDYKELRRIKKERYHKMDKMISLALSKRCIHKSIVNYFGFNYEGKCNMCSNCKKCK